MPNVPASVMESSPYFFQRNVSFLRIEFNGRVAAVWVDTLPTNLREKPVHASGCMECGVIETCINQYEDASTCSSTVIHFTSSTVLNP